MITIMELTREELEILVESMGVLMSENDYGDNQEEVREWKRVLEKVRSMIHSHCEHEPGESFHEAFIWTMCTKCGAQYK